MQKLEVAGLRAKESSRLPTVGGSRGCLVELLHWDTPIESCSEW